MNTEHAFLNTPDVQTAPQSVRQHKDLEEITARAAPKLEQYVRSTDIFSGDGSADSFQTVAIIVMVTKKTNHL